MNRAVFLDRDGTLHEDPGYLHEPEKLQVFSDVPPALARLKSAGFLLIVVTNQCAIGDGMYTQDDMEAVHRALQDHLAQFDVQIDAFFFCPHATNEACSCRKPLPGMLFDARDQFNIDLSASFMVGDHGTDMQAGKAVGCTTILVTTGHGEEELEGLQRAGTMVTDYVVANLSEAAQIICAIYEQSRC
jgi:D-glycero-D-manno-heptose 1,7-bisphosphate phosphatase